MANEKEVVKETAPVPVPERKFELREGDIQLFHNTKKKDDADYEFWGRAVLPGAQVKFLRFWKAEAKSGRQYFKGYNLDAADDFNNLAAPKDDKHPDHTVLFFNESFDSTATEKIKPMYTGRINHDKETFRLSLWNKKGPKGEFYSGLITPEAVSEGTEDLPEEEPAK